MGLFEQFPYTNFHELNLDWIVSIVKDLSAKYVELTGDVAGLKTYIDNYFQNMDLSADVRQEIQKLVASGEFDAIVSNAVEQIVPEYMETYKQQIDTSISSQNNIIPMGCISGSMRIIHNSFCSF